MPTMWCNGGGYLENLGRQSKRTVAFIIRRGSWALSDLGDGLRSSRGGPLFGLQDQVSQKLRDSALALFRIVALRCGQRNREVIDFLLPLHGPPFGRTTFGAFHYESLSIGNFVRNSSCNTHRALSPLRLPTLPRGLAEPLAQMPKKLKSFLSNGCLTVPHGSPSRSEFARVPNGITWINSVSRWFIGAYHYTTGQ